MTTDIRRFDSVSAYLRATTGPVTPGATRSSSEREERTRGGNGWYGTPDLETARTMALRWDEGASAIKRMRVKASAGVRNRVHYKRSVTGPGSLVMPDVIQGTPDPYRRRIVVAQKTSGRGKIVRILLNNAASAAVNSDVYLARGGAVLALADALEKAGRRVEITVGFGIRAVSDSKNAATDAFLVTVKKASDKANMASMAFAIAHPSMLRRITLAVMERQSPEFVQRIVNNMYGCPAPLDSTGYDIYLGEAYSDGTNVAWQDENSAREWVTAELSKLGVTIS